MIAVKNNLKSNTYNENIKFNPPSSKTLKKINKIRHKNSHKEKQNTVGKDAPSCL